MFFVYILHSDKLDRFYIGQTDNLKVRLQEHLSKIFPHSFTAKADDWVVFYYFSCDSRKTAMKIENHLKKMKNKKYYYNLRSYPEIIENLKIKYAD